MGCVTEGKKDIETKMLEVHLRNSHNLQNPEKIINNTMLRFNLSREEACTRLLDTYEVLFMELSEQLEAHIP